MQKKFNFVNTQNIFYLQYSWRTVSFSIIKTHTNKIGFLPCPHPLLPAPNPMSWRKLSLNFSGFLGFLSLLSPPFSFLSSFSCFPHTLSLHFWSYPFLCNTNLGQRPLSSFSPNTWTSLLFIIINTLLIVCQTFLTQIFFLTGIFFF